MVNELGFNVHGMDLSAESIHLAKTKENESLKFSVEDLRYYKNHNAYHLILNLFTSFGYFDNEEVNIQVLKNFHDSLRADGMLVLDFMNAHKVKQSLVPQETKVLSDIKFRISRTVENNVIIKTINFVDSEGEDKFFQERVSAFEIEDFHRLFQESGFEICHIFGDYNLNKFDRIKSPRLILIAKPI